MLNGCYTIVTRLLNELHGEMVMGSVAGPPDIWLKGGLITREHRERMGEALWLYLYLQQRAWFNGQRAGEIRPDEDGKPYQHADAAHALFGTDASGQPAAIRTVKRWMAQLEDEGYIETRRLPYGLVVRITKYDQARDRARRRKERSATDGTTDLETAREVPQVAPPEVPKSVERSATTCTPEVPQPAKRSAKNGPSIYKDAGATNGTRDSSGTNVEGANAPAPAVRGNPNVQAAIDALRAEGMTGVLTPRDRAALKSSDADLKEMARLYAAISRGEYPPSGDQYFLDNLSVCLCLEKLPGWLAYQKGHRAPAKENGRYSRAKANADAIEDFGKVLDDAGYNRRPQESLPAVRAQLRGLPS